MNRGPYSSVKIIIEVLQRFLDAVGDLYYDWAVVMLAKESPTLGALPAALHEDEVWPQGRRSAVLSTLPDLERVRRRFHVVNISNLTTKSGRNFALLLKEARKVAEQEGIPWLREWHLAKAIVDTDASNTLRGLGIDPEALVRRVGQIEGRIQLDPPDLAKAWCFCDANVFLHYAPFDQVDWPSELGYKAVVLVVPVAVLRALDRYKSDREHKRQQKRARQVLPLFGKYGLVVSPGALAPVRSGVELLLRDREPPIPGDFDAADPDDRIVADALDFRWTHPGANVLVLSGDYAVRLKARGRGLEQRAVPDHLELESCKPPAGQDGETPSTTN